MAALRVLFFAALRERVGCSEFDLELPPGSTVADVRRALEERFPALESQVYRCALEAAYVGDTDSLPESGELALVPPVSGG